jgi:5-methylcytosine-specific restriction endonuclease McrBC GTP-binding regulatory subunit McrB
MSVKYPDFLSAMKPVPHGEELPTLCDKKIKITLLFSVIILACVV